ncbi:MAG: methyltransferase domain-containing protein [Planctomycetota bacterium]
MDTIHRIRADFDRIALLDHDGFDHNAHYHQWLLGQLPARINHALEVGCGTGRFSRLLATRAARVHGVDVSAGMIRVARARSSHAPQIQFEVADVARWRWPVALHDCVVSIATLHHLPLAPTLLAMRRALAPGGTLAILDLVQGRIDLELVARAVALFLRLRRTGAFRASRAVRQAWAEHARHDRICSLPDVRQACARVLPGARVRRHLLWRYSILWQRPDRA